MSSNMNMENNSRIPLIPLEYENRHLAYKKEILFDYDTGRMYVVSKEDKTIIYDITAEILKIVASNLPADTLVVTINGVGTVNLTEYLNALKNDYLDSEDDESHSSIPSSCYDMASIINKDNKIQIVDFDVAEDSTIPVKRNRITRWVPSTGVDAINQAEIRDGYVELIKPLNYTFMDGGTQFELKVLNTAAGYRNVIEWFVETSITIPTLQCHPDVNLHMQYDTDLSLRANHVYFFRFETYDGGQNWYGTRQTFNKTIEQTQIDYGYMLDNYYTKAEVQDILHWKDNQNNSIED